MKHFQKLASLSLASNYLTEIPAGALAGAPKLSSVILRNNQISNIAPHAFNNEALEMVDLSHNSLTSLSARSLSITSAGVVISVADNKISFIEKDAFLFTNLLQLDLSGNALKSLPPTTFYPIVKTLVSNHGAMILGDNPLSCNNCNDYRWIVLNARVFSRMLIEFECVDGNTVSDLDYDIIGC